MTTGKDYKAIIGGIGAYSAELRRMAPATMQGFGALAKAASAAGAVDAKTKEMIALAIGVTQHCDGCIGYHAKALADSAPPAGRCPRCSACASTWAAGQR